MKRTGILALLLLLLSTPAASVAENVCAPSGVVSKVTFRSAMPFTHEELQRSFGVLPGQQLSRELLTEARVALLRRGVILHVDYILRCGPGESVAVEVLLTPRATIGTLSFRGNYHADNTLLRRWFGLRIGNPFTVRQLEQSVASALTFYARDGFREANIRVRTGIRPGTSQVELAFVVEEGYRSTFGDVEIRGRLPSDVAHLTDHFLRRTDGLTASASNIEKVRQ